MTTADSKFLSYLRSLSIFVIVFGHVGGFWLFKPYSEFLHVFVPVFFFISGAVSLSTYEKSENFFAYYIKRLTGLLVPYYLLCILSLLVFVFVNQHLPTFDINNLILWVQVRPTKEISPFPVGHVWFLNTLLFIILFSPLYYKLNGWSETGVVVVILVFVFLSGIQLFIDVDEYFNLYGNNVYKPVVHSSFFMFGILYINSRSFRKKILCKYSIYLSLFSVLLSVFLVKILNINIDYSHHTFAPDLYYVLGSFAAILFAINFRHLFISMVERYKIVIWSFKFFYKHTFSIFLLHTFVMYLADSLIGPVHASERTLIYGAIKFSIILLVTCLIAIPFSKLSNILLVELLDNT